MATITKPIDITKVKPLASGQWVCDSYTTEGVVYVVRADERGALQCMCDAAIHGRYCRHLTTVVRYIAEGQKRNADNRACVARPAARRDLPTETEMVAARASLRSLMSGGKR